MEDERPGQDVAPPEETPIPTRQARPLRRALKIGCVATLLVVCGCFGTFAVLLQSGPVTIGLPFGGALRLGSDDFVLSNYSFRDGMTYFLDFNGNGQRNILEFRHTKDDNRLEIVLHHADGKSQGDTRLLTLDLP
jgi:hypothetical protein